MCLWESCSPNKTFFFWLNRHLNCYINHSSFVIVTTLYSQIPQPFADPVTWHSSIYSVRIHLMSTYYVFDTGASQMQACPPGAYSQVRDACRAVNMKVVEAQCAWGAHRRGQYWKTIDFSKSKAGQVELGRGRGGEKSIEEAQVCQDEKDKGTEWAKPTS